MASSKVLVSSRPEHRTCRDARNDAKRLGQTAARFLRPIIPDLDHNQEAEIENESIAARGFTASPGARGAGARGPGGHRQ
jgi:hypothetical protein